MGYLFAFLILSGFGYTVVILILFYALQRVRPGRSEVKPFVSVVIAARNEEDVISSCLNLLKQQNYPSEMFEIIVVNDRSEDCTSEILAVFQSEWEQLKVVTVKSVPDGLSPKKYALSKAIGQARGEIILQTDADCHVPETWISGMVRSFEEGIDMVTGIAPYFKHPGMLNSFVRHEYLWNAALSGGSIALGYGTHASGRNLGFRKEAFETAGGYGAAGKILSGDDTLLLHTIQSRKKTSVVTIPDTSTQVYSEAPGDFKSLARQRLRHLSTGKYFDPVPIVIGSIFYSFHIAIVLSLAVTVVSITAGGAFLISFLWKAALAALLAKRTKSVFGLEIEWRRFLIHEFLLILYMAIMPAAGLLFPVKWKEK